MIDKHKLELILRINQKYDIKAYLSNFQSIRKCIAIITDNQMAFLEAINEFKGLEHYMLVNNLSKAMNINLDKGYKLFFVATFNNEIYISLPSDKKVSLNQVALLYKLLNQIEEYNKQEKVVKAKVKCIHAPDLENIDSMKIDFLNYITDKEKLDNENIIGIIPSENDIKEVLEKYVQNKSQNLIDSLRIK